MAGIVKYIPDLPEEGSVVYADNHPYSSDRAIYKGGEFIGGGEYPVREYRMGFVHKWFYMSDYDARQTGSCYTISFEQAEEMGE